MNIMMDINKVVALLFFVGFLPAYAMENNQKKNKRAETAKEAKRKREEQVCAMESLHKKCKSKDVKKTVFEVVEKEFKAEFLKYPRDAEIIVDKGWMDRNNVVRMCNTFIVPQGFNPELICKDFIPVIVPDFKLKELK